MKKSVFLLQSFAVVQALQLRYFDARGAAETSRVMLKYDGTDFVDERWSIDEKFFSEGFANAKADGSLAANLNRGPVLVVDTIVLGQSKAIERYIARRCHLFGENELDEAQIDAIAEHVRDVAAAQRAKGFSPFNRDKSEEARAQLKDEWFSKDLPDWLARINAALPDNSGFAYGSRRSYADFCLWNAFYDVPRQDKSADFDALLSTLASVAPNILAICKSVDAEPAVAKWLSDRPDNRF